MPMEKFEMPSYNKFPIIVCPWRRIYDTNSTRHCSIYLSKFLIAANLLYINSKYTVLSAKKEKIPSSPISIDPTKSMYRARQTVSPYWSIMGAEEEYGWTTKMDRVRIIRNGLTYESIEVISTRANLPVKQVLHLLGVAQTPYN